MKTINVNVPDDYDVPHSIYSDDAHKIITIGDIMFVKGMHLISENNPQHQKEIDYIKGNHEVEVKALHQKLVDTTEQFKQQIESMMNMNRNLQEHNDKIAREHMLQIHNMTIENMKKIDELRKEKDDVIKSSGTNHENLINKIDSLFGSGNSIDNVEKGNFGEDYVTNYITTEYPDSELDDVSGETAHGDCIWKLNAHSFSCLVEVKNVAHSRNLDVNKFIRDVDINTSNGLVNCGLFVSLKTDNIPNKGKFKCELLNGFPILYVSGIWKNPVLLSFALRTIQCLRIMNKDSQADIDTTFINEFVGNIYENLIKEQNLINDMRKSIEQMNVLIQKAQANITKSIKYVEDCITRQGISVSVQNDDETIDFYVEKVVEYKKEHDRWPKMADIGFPKGNKEFNFRQVITMAKENM